MDTRNRWIRLYDLGFAALGAQGWWPARNPFEVIVGAILAQHTAWRNAERALLRLREAGVLTPRGMAALPAARLARVIRPAGTYRGKARALRAFLTALRRDFGGQVGGLLRQPAEALRTWLMRVPGIGPETADCILLYAAGSPAFVADAYARRILARHGLVPFGAAYEGVRRRGEARLPPDPALLGELHALLVTVGRRFCRTVPRCSACPLRPDLPNGVHLAPVRAIRRAKPSAPSGSRRTTGAERWPT